MASILHHQKPELPRQVLEAWKPSHVTFDPFAVNPSTPRSTTLDIILPHLVVVPITHYNFHGNIQDGSLVVHEDIAPQVASLFHHMCMVRFPLTGIAPIADPRLAHSDNEAMKRNITTGWNYREKTGGGGLSEHALGYAVDINPLLNPYVKGDLILPPGAQYVPGLPGVLTHDHPVVLFAKELGVIWGGDWESLKDYQHFEFPRPSTT